MNLAVVIILFVAGLIGIILFALWYTRFMLNKMVVEKHTMVEYIVQTGKIPESWSNRNCINKLDETIAYVKYTPIIDDEETRAGLLSQLLDIRILWIENIKGKM